MSAYKNVFFLVDYIFSFLLQPGKDLNIAVDKWNRNRC